MRTNDIILKMYGKEYIDKINAFETELKNIELKHKDYFNSRFNKTNPDSIDSLESHWAITYNKDGLSFKILKDSDLDANIINECNEAFNRVFG